MTGLRECVVMALRRSGNVKTILVMIMKQCFLSTRNGQTNAKVHQVNLMNVEHRSLLSEMLTDLDSEFACQVQTSSTHGLKAS